MGLHQSSSRLYHIHHSIAVNVIGLNHKPARLPMWHCRRRADSSHVFVKAQHPDVVLAGLHVWSKSKQRRSVLLSSQPVQHRRLRLTWPITYIEMRMRSRTFALLFRSTFGLIRPKRFFLVSFMHCIGLSFLRDRLKPCYLSR